MIRPTYGPSASLISGRWAWITMSTMITYEAIIRVWTIIRILMGICFLRRDTVKEDIDRVKISPAFMTMVFIRRFVTARVEQIPSTCLRTGLSCHRPALNICVFDSVLCI
jgi:hypothetical protein